MRERGGQTMATNTVKVDSTTSQPGKWGPIAAWFAYDWASSAPFAIIVTFVFATYFTESVAGDTTVGTVLWGQMMGASGIAMAILAVLLGPVADAGAGRKIWLACFTGIAILAGIAMWWIQPDPSWIIPALTLAFLVNVGLEVAMVFYNSMLPGLAPPNMVGRLSGWGWGIGYIGAIVCLFLALFVVKAEPPAFGLSAEASEPVRLTSVVASVWLLTFSLPLFLMVREPRRTAGMSKAIADGLKTLSDTLTMLKHQGNILLFLVAHMIYRNGLNTMFSFGGVYAAGTFGMETEQILLFGVTIYISAGIGAFIFAWVDDRIGGRKTVLLSLCGLLVFGIPLLLVESHTAFFGLGIGIGLFFGPAQSASRSLMARLTPPGHEGRSFGLFGLSGKATAFLGPPLVGWATLIGESQRVGMATVMAFFVVGAILLSFVREPTD